MDKDFYNKSSAQSLGWDPTWFGEKYFDDKLVRAIKRFQSAMVWVLMVCVDRHIPLSLDRAPRKH